ncbi:RRQRL motif-containing zinc-binding protein [Streptomyces sp. WG4]|uniref:RRQRL motif-containing zinc-binding protein n=1 Tax=Streptomyces sp. WG4 TaxID=3417649 RepID=UPI003CF5833E
MRAAGLRPGGHDPVAILRCKACATRPGRTCTRPAYLYRVDLAKPVRPMTLAREAALDAAMAARTTRPVCRRRYHYVLPLRTLGSCLECWDGTPADPLHLHRAPPHAPAGRVTPRRGRGPGAAAASAEVRDRPGPLRTPSRRPQRSSVCPPARHPMTSPRRRHPYDRPAGASTRPAQAEHRLTEPSRHDTKGMTV